MKDSISQKLAIKKAELNLLNELAVLAPTDIDEVIDWLEKKAKQIRGELGQ